MKMREDLPSLGQTKSFQGFAIEPGNYLTTRNLYCGNRPNTTDRKTPMNKQQ